MKLKVFKQEDRVWWDLFVFIVIIIATFEIPYEMLVDIKNPKIDSFFDYLFIVVFGADIFINCISIQEVGNNGILGIRKLFPKKFFDPSSEQNSNGGVKIVRDYPLTMLAYVTSWWFIVDFVAIFPFEMVFGAYAGLNMSRSLRLARITRLLRIFRVIRAVKAVKALHSIDKVFHLNPSLGRFVIICVTVPWLLHFFACLLSYYESVPSGLGYSYTESLEHLFVTFTTNNRAEFSTMGGKITSTAAVIFGYLFFGILMGNFASFFENIDAKKALLEEKISEWKIIFKSYPQIFDKTIQKRILLSVKQNVTSSIDHEMLNLVKSLDAALETEILNRISALKSKS